jgi:hypothetical protein
MFKSLTDAATGGRDHLLDLIALDRGLASFEARAFLRLPPSASPTLLDHRPRRAVRPTLRAARSLFRARSPRRWLKPISGIAASAQPPSPSPFFVFIRVAMTLRPMTRCAHCLRPDVAGIERLDSATVAPPIDRGHDPAR